jgi:PhnB protein
VNLNPYLSFSGNCEAAFKFYERALGGKILMMMPWGESPMADQTPANFRSKIMHARLAVGEETLMGSDAPPDRYEASKGISVCLGVDKPEDADRIFQALSEKATVTMPIQKTFWALRFGMLTDQFGIPWMINCEAPPH